MHHKRSFAPLKILATTASCTAFTSVISPYNFASRVLLCLFAKHHLSQWWMGWLREAGGERAHTNGVLVPSSGQLCSAPCSSFREGLCNCQPCFLRPQASTPQTGTWRNRKSALDSHAFRWFFKVQAAFTWRVGPSSVTVNTDKWVLKSNLGYWKEALHPGLFQGVLKHLHVKKKKKR